MSPELRREIRQLVRYEDWRRRGPRGRAACEACGERLDYDYGSITWQVVERHLCPICAAKEATKRMATTRAN